MSRSGFSGPCFNCCSCNGPAFAYVQRSASRGKIGWTEFVDPSSPPKYYLTETWSSDGGGACTGPYLNCNGTVSTAGSASYDPTTGGCSGTDSRNGGEVVSSCGQSYFYATCWALEGDCNEADSGLGPNQPVDSGPEYTQTTYNETWSCGGCSASATASLSNQYTTTELEAITVAALPTWGEISDFGLGMPGEIASSVLASNETSYSVMDGKYQFAIPTSPTGYFLLSWTVRFTPDGGGAPTDTNMTFEWDGDVPPDYDQTDPTTWPQTSIFEVDHPATPGGISIINVKINCGGGANNVSL